MRETWVASSCLSHMLFFTPWYFSANDGDDTPHPTPEPNHVQSWIILSYQRFPVAIGRASLSESVFPSWQNASLPVFLDAQVWAETALELAPCLQTQGSFYLKRSPVLYQPCVCGSNHPFGLSYHLQPHLISLLLSTNGILWISHAIMWITLFPGPEPECLGDKLQSYLRLDFITQGSPLFGTAARLVLALLPGIVSGMQQWIMLNSLSRTFVGTTVWM